MDQAVLERRLTEILARVVEPERGAQPITERSATEEFAVLGVNSVDLMEFILRVETELKVDVLAGMLPEELPTTLRGWAQFLSKRLEQSTGS